MQKTRKQRFAEWLIANKGQVSAERVMKFSNEHGLGIQVKTRNSSGDFVIKFSESDPFIDPSEWLHNYQVSSLERYKEALAIIKSLGLPAGELDEANDKLTEDVLRQANFYICNNRLCYPASLSEFVAKAKANKSRNPYLDFPGAVRNTVFSDFQRIASVDYEMLESEIRHS